VSLVIQNLQSRSLIDVMGAPRDPRRIQLAHASAAPSPFVLGPPPSDAGALGTYPPKVPNPSIIADDPCASARRSLSRKAGNQNPCESPQPLPTSDPRIVAAMSGQA